MKPYKPLYIGLLLMFLFNSCNENTPQLVNEDELITTVEVTLESNLQTILLKSIDSILIHFQFELKLA